jgi:Domain of unknown function (DUF4271)
MGKRIIVLSFCWILVSICFAQTTLPDSTHYKTLPTSYWPLQQWVSANAPEQAIGKPVQFFNADWKFYIAVILLLFFGLFKFLFPKYIDNIFALLFKSTVKAKQIREQIGDALLPSILLNLFFTLVLGVFAYLVAQHYVPNLQKHKLLAIGAAIVLVMAIYLVKYLFLVFFGWLFQAKEPAAAYVFTVFYFNKIVGMVLLPVVVFMLLSRELHDYIIIVSLFLVSLIVLYRYIFSYISMQKMVQMSQFHFFLYLCTLEIMPLLLIYKGLMVNYSKLL